MASTKVIVRSEKAKKAIRTRGELDGIHGDR